MPRNNKTSNVLKLLNLKEYFDIGDDGNRPAPNVGNDASALRAASPLKFSETDGAPGASHPTLERPRRPRKNITKHMKLEKLSESVGENPALKAITEEKNAEPEEIIERVFIRPSESISERQIVSVPLLLILEQLGTAVERFNACACDECLRGITDRALDLMPPMYIRVVNAADENEVNRLIKERRPEVIRILAKICIAANKKPFHDE
ncbi:MAG: hypothetical protein FWD48_05040 [Oscillospiraceae bacterium]|nr:hypothetical protein [Oscillospiraceae bacterium]